MLAVVVRSALEATGASAGWLLAVEGSVLRVVASAAVDGPGPPLSATVPAGSGSSGFVAASGQPLAVSPRGDDRFGDGMATLLGRRPTSILAVPCMSDDAVVGVLELVDKLGSASFSFDDVELATLLAGIAGAGIRFTGERRPAVPGPSELGGDLARLAAADPARYAGVAAAVAALLMSG